MFRHIRLMNKTIKKIEEKKLKNLAPETPKNKKSKKEMSSKLMLKTVNVQKH